MTRFFIADTHFHHCADNNKPDRKNIIELMCRTAPNGQLFSSQEEHDRHIIDNINSLVAREDELFIIGDFAFDKPGKFRAKIKCKHIRFLLGNHDRKSASLNIFGSIPEVLRTKVYNAKRNDFIQLFLCHYPSSYWDGSHRGWGHLYGHCHGQREDYLDSIEPQRRALDVGVDNIKRLYGDYRPLSEYEVYDYMAKRSGHDDVRFYKDYQNALLLEKGFI